MKRFKIYEDTENVKPVKKSRGKADGKRRQALGEIKNVIVTRSKTSLEINSGVKFIKLNNKNVISNNKKTIPKKSSGKVENNKLLQNENKKSVTEQNNQKRLSSIIKVSDYANDIYRYLRYLEIKYELKENENVRLKFKEGTRLALIDWFVEMHEYAQMSQDTFQLSVSIMDRYLQKDASITKKELQLVALSSSLVSSKYEEIAPIEVCELMFVSDNAYSEKDILEMEINILGALDFSFGKPVAANFIRRYTIVSNASRIEQSLAMYFSDVALLSYELCYSRPSLIASAAFYIALCVSRDEINPEFWDSTLVCYSLYKFDEFKDIVAILADLVVRSSISDYEAIKRKYSQSHYQSVSLLPGLNPKEGIIVRLTND